MRERLEGLHRRLCRHRAWRFGELLARGYLDHDVGKSAAALAYYLLFSFFPLLIFLSTLVGFLELPPLWLPMRAVDSLMKAVNVSYGIKSPRPTLRHQLVVGLYTLFLMAVMMLTLVLMLAGRGFLTFLSRYLPVIQPFIGLWNALRFPIMGTAFFLALGVLYWVAPGITGPRRRVFPGAVAALCSWLVFSLGFSFYVENIANYSVLYGALGGMVVLLLWLYATATVLIMGAEVNRALVQSAA